MHERGEIDGAKEERVDLAASGRLTSREGIKEYSDWQTIPQLYVSNDFVGGTDIMMSMHQDGSLAKLLEEKEVLMPAEGEASS